MGWNEQIADATFGGVPFEVVSVADVYGRRVQLSEYPYRDGADVEDLGREARPTEIEAIFHGDDYLSDLGALQLMFEAGSEETFVHPLLGSWKARLTRMVVQHNSNARDAATISLTLRESSTDQQLPDLSSVEAAKADITAQADAIGTALTAAFDEVPETASSALDDARAMVSDVDATLGELNTRLDQLNYAIDQAVADVVALGDVASYPIVRQLRGLSLRGQRLAQQVERLQPAVIEMEIAADVPLPVLAVRLYGDANRSGDISRLNKLRNPFVVPKGITIRVYDR